MSNLLIACEKVAWAFRCHQRWDALTRTEDADVRHCAECQQAVHRAHSVEAVNTFARQGLCVAWREPNTDSVAPTALGEPARHY